MEKEKIKKIDSCFCPSRRAFDEMEKNGKKEKKRVFVMMSGGVDSSVAAGLLKKAGYDVLGVHLICWDEESFGCSAGEDRRDAERVAVILDIPFEVWDLKKEYKKKVFDYMISEYKKGRVPNPDVMCNKKIKFGIFFKEAMRRGADYVATGHYARVECELKIGNGKFKGKKKEVFKLIEGKDKDKDQSYFLWTLGQKELSKTIFPLGKMLKSEVRREAKKMKLLNAEKKDSQGLCFIGKVDFQDFLRKKIKEKEGVIKDIKGKIIGKHKGSFYYSIGQRKNIGLLGGSEEPFYVLKKDLKKNELIVGKRNSKEAYFKKVVLKDINFIEEGVVDKLKRGKEKIWAKIRYRGEKLPVKLKKEKGKWVICFEKKAEFISVGQSAVFYLTGGELIGGGVFDRVLT